MRLSHSKLATLLSCPMTYYLSYVEGISKKETKSALAIGSAVHWGIEHDTEDLSEYYKEEGTFKQGDNYTRDQILAESMVHGYLKHKESLFKQLLTDPKTKEQVTLIDEMHELFLSGKLPSKLHSLPHEFVGIIDLLLLTDKGFILIDYKTSSMVPDWDNYLDQIYRYIMLLETNFPDVPIYKIGIINIRKTGIRQKKNETEFEFTQRLRLEYELNDENYINYHEYLPEELDQNHIKDYIDNLSKMADAGETIVNNKMWFINYSAANGTYGKSDFWDIFYKTPDAHVLYKIKDRHWNEEIEAFEDFRDCRPLDMMVIDKTNVMNHIEKFNEALSNFVEVNDINSKLQRGELKSLDDIRDTFYKYLNEYFICDKELLDLYWITSKKDSENM